MASTDLGSRNGASPNSRSMSHETVHSANHFVHANTDLCLRKPFGQIATTPATLRIMRIDVLRAMGGLACRVRMLPY